MLPRARTSDIRSRTHGGATWRARRRCCTYVARYGGTDDWISMGKIHSDLVNLEPRAVVHAAFRRYRYLPLRPPGYLMAQMFDGDGVRLARTALSWIAHGDRVPPDPLLGGWGERSRAISRTDGTVPKRQMLPIRATQPTKSWCWTVVAVVGV